MVEDEQKHPANAPGEWKRPNFGLIVALFAVAIVLVLTAGYFFMHRDGRMVVPQQQQTVPSQN